MTLRPSYNLTLVPSNISQLHSSSAASLPQAAPMRLQTAHGSPPPDQPDKQAQLNLTTGKMGACSTQGPDRATETESAVCRCLLSAGRLWEQPAQPPWSVLAGNTLHGARGHAPTHSSAATWHFFPPFPKPNSDHLLKYFCKSSLSQEGPGAEFTCLYSVWHFCSAYHFSIQAISFKLSISFEEPE